MLSKSIRATKQDLSLIEKIIENDIRVNKSTSEAIYYAYSDISKDIPDWNDIKFKRKINDSDNNAGGTISFKVDENDLNKVMNSIHEKLGMKNVTISFATRLCLELQNKRLKEKKYESIVSNEIYSYEEKIVRVARYEKLLKIANDTMKGELEEINEKVKKLIENYKKTNFTED